MHKHLLQTGDLKACGSGTGIWVCQQDVTGIGMSTARGLLYNGFPKTWSHACNLFLKGKSLGPFLVSGCLCSLLAQPLLSSSNPETSMRRERSKHACCCFLPCRYVFAMEAS